METGGIEPYAARPLRASVRECGFGFYTASEIERLSVLQITSSQAFDELGNPVPGGLNDPRLGPTERMEKCISCGMNDRDCPGHIGHISLPLPTYHPLLMDNLSHLLRSQCAYCQRFRLSTLRKRAYALLLKLYQSGLWKEAEEADDCLAGLLASKTGRKDAVKYIEDLERKFKKLAKKRNGHILSNHERILRQKFTKKVLDELVHAGGCGECGATSPKIRKDGYTKFFELPLSKKAKTANSALGVHRYEGNGGANEENDSDDDEPMSDEEAEMEERTGVTKQVTKQKYLPPSEVESRVRMLWSKKEDQALLDALFGRMLSSNTSHNLATPGDVDTTYSLFFVKTLAVPPPRFRPPSVVGGVKSENPQNVQLGKVLRISDKIRSMQGVSEATPTNSSKDKLASLISAWIELQTGVNGFMDASKDTGMDAPTYGIRQLLERKQGLFRMNMMGKRVNHACRSVISPDLNVRAGEIGLPLRFARALSWPENVSVHNVAHLRLLVERGGDEYPGANWVRDADGRMINLARLNSHKRKAVAKRLLAGQGQTVGRHLVDGDLVIMNRQPTLHKPSMMAHQVRVFKYLPPSQQTIRMHYANCSSYNADFDGDEMNCHLPMSLHARAEAQEIIHNPHQYIVPTDGSPIRGLIQDHVDAAVKLTQKDTFLSREMFLQLLTPAISVMSLAFPLEKKLTLPAPAMLKPRELWTGKQVFSTLVRLLVQHTSATLEQRSWLSFTGKSKTPAWAYGEESLEHQPLWRNGELLRGIIDKASIGDAGRGFIHSIFELYGPYAASTMLDAVGRVLSGWLQFTGHSCGLADLMLTPEAEQTRREMLTEAKEHVAVSARDFLNDRDAEAKAKAVATGEMAAEDVSQAASGKSGGSGATLSQGDKQQVQAGLGRLLSIGGEGPDTCAALDSELQGALADPSSRAIKACLPRGLAYPTWAPGERSGGKHANGFGLMVTVGAKGSTVNQSQVTVCLGQQALEGRRVPHMISGKTLPSFSPWIHTVDARAGGFVTDRFLSGLRPQEYYFHCMGGREGLVDTAVKTSRSGYLQRCLVKGLEELTVAYDHSVRDSNGNILQFIYGEDGLDVTKAFFLDASSKTLDFVDANASTFANKWSSVRTDKPSQLASKALSSHSKIDLWKEQHRSGVTEMKEGSVVIARKQLPDREEWGRGDLASGWHRAVVVKVKKGKKARTVHLRYDDDPETVCKLPEEVRWVKRGNALQLARDGGDDAAEAMTTTTAEDGDEKAKGDLERQRRMRSERWRLMEKDAEHGGRPGDFTRVPLVLGVGDPRLPMHEQLPCPVSSDLSIPAHVPSVLSEKMHEALLGKRAELVSAVQNKWGRALCAPGESVGTLAAQSIGEPSTQMTLNTFHLAGHGGANVTLGIPRLRELLMTASKELKTPTMTIPMTIPVSAESKLKAHALARRLQRLTLDELMASRNGVRVRESIVSEGGIYKRMYDIRLSFQKPKLIKKAFGVSWKQLVKVANTVLVAHIYKLVNAELRKQKSTLVGGSTKPEDVDVMEDIQSEAPASRKRGRKNAKADAADDDEDEDDEDDEANAEQDGSLRFGRREEETNYDDDEEEDEEEETASDRAAKNPLMDIEAGVDDDDDEEGKGKKPAGNWKDVKTDVDDKAATVSLTLFAPASSARVLMVQLCELAAAKTVVSERPGVSCAHVVEREVMQSVDKLATGSVGKEKRWALFTEGCNFSTMWALEMELGISPDESLLDLNQLAANDVNAILLTYGVEAARAAIVEEVRGVFDVYGIEVDPRHLNLVADAMTFGGGYRAFNRLGIAESSSSPFLQMSFETTATFLTQAAVVGDPDYLTSPSARIVLGQQAKQGTGICEIRSDFSKQLAAARF